METSQTLFTSSFISPLLPPPSPSVSLYLPLSSSLWSPVLESDGLIKAAHNEGGEEEEEEEEEEERRGGQEGEREKKGVMIRGMSHSYQSRSLFKHSTPFLVLLDAAAAPGFSHSAGFAMK